MPSLLKNILPLAWMRLASASALMFLLYWIFSDLDIRFNLFKTLIPLSYLFKITKVEPQKSIFLLLPILVNIALWTPSYYSYVFLRVVIYAERIKLYCIMVLCAITSALGLATMHKNGINEAVHTLLVYVFIVGILFYWNKAVLSNFKTEEMKKYFKSEHKDEQEIKKATRLLLVMFAGAVYYIYFR